MKTYNEKGFLLPNSIKSMAAYHAKVKEDGEYVFRIHDCITGIRLLGNLYDKEDRHDAIVKLMTLAVAACDMCKWIMDNAVNNENTNEK